MLQLLFSGAGLLWGAVTATVTALAVSMAFLNFEGNQGTHISLSFVWFPSITPLTPFFKSPDVFLHAFNYSRGMHYLLGIMRFGFPVARVGVHASLPFLPLRLLEASFLTTKGKGPACTLNISILGKSFTCCKQ